MVDVLTEENRMLRQEMEACREKVTKLHKVTSTEVLWLLMAGIVPPVISASSDGGQNSQ